MIIAGWRRAVFPADEGTHRFRPEIPPDPRYQTTRRARQPLNDHPLNIVPLASPGRTAPKRIAAKADAHHRHRHAAARTSPPDSWTAFDKAARNRLDQCCAPRCGQAPLAAVVGRREALVPNCDQGAWIRAWALIIRPWLDHAGPGRAQGLGHLCRGQCGPRQPAQLLMAQGIGVRQALLRSPRPAWSPLRVVFPPKSPQTGARSTSALSYVEFGFSCIGHTRSPAAGAPALPQMERETGQGQPSVLVGDGGLSLDELRNTNSSVLTDKKLIILVARQWRFLPSTKQAADQHRNESFNNLIADLPDSGQPFAVDFGAHAASMDAIGRDRGQSRGAEGEAFQARQGEPEDPRHRHEGRRL